MGSPEMEGLQEEQIWKGRSEFNSVHDCLLSIQVQVLRLEFWKEVWTRGLKSLHAEAHESV